jgi:hypothetical protein
LCTGICVRTTIFKIEEVLMVITVAGHGVFRNICGFIHCVVGDVEGVAFVEAGTGGWWEGVDEEGCGYEDEEEDDQGPEGEEGSVGHGSGVVRFLV